VPKAFRSTDWLGAWFIDCEFRAAVNAEEGAIGHNAYNNASPPVQVLAGSGRELA
jgi:hypothetical protein